MIKKIIEKAKENIDNLKRNTLKIALTILAVLLFLGAVVFLIVIITQEVINNLDTIITGAIIITCVVLVFYAIKMKYGSSEKRIETPKPIPQAGKDLIKYNYKQFFFEVISELYPRLHIQKPLDVEAMNFENNPCTDFLRTTLSVNMSDNAPIDDMSLEESKYILQERIKERIYNNKAYGIPLNVYENQISLVVTDITLSGRKYKIEIVWANNQAACEYIKSRRRTGGNPITIQPNDNIF